MLSNSVSFLFLTQCLVALGFPPDQVQRLPGLTPNAPFKHYSGYLNATVGRFLHYWLVESQSQPDKDPVVLWFNGGPGCSSMSGLFTEIGPWKINDNLTTLRTNPWSWNRLANVLFIESPAGVGFSYRTDGRLKTSDEETTQDNYEAVKSFFKKFPKLANNSFYITGESYAGVYIPMLALKMKIDDSPVRLRGVAIGNPLLDLDTRAQTYPQYLNQYGLVDSELWSDAETKCCRCNANGRSSCDFNPKVNGSCKKALDKIYQAVTPLNTKTGINPYNVHKRCHWGMPQVEGQWHGKADLENLDHFIDPINQLSADKSPCSNADFAKYLNNNETRRAIHVSVDLPKWGRCNHQVNRNYTKQLTSMGQVLRGLVNMNISVMIYSGDLDSVCNGPGNEQFLSSLGYNLTRRHRAWKADGQLAGYLKRWSTDFKFEGLSFVTVIGAGHMVPEDKPKPAFEILKELVGIKKLDQ